MKNLLIIVAIVCFARMITIGQEYHKSHSPVKEAKASKALLPGTEVVLSTPYTTNCAIEWNGAINTSLLGSHYYVITTTAITCNGVTYQIVDLAPRESYNPGISWPEANLKLALPHF